MRRDDLPTVTIDGRTTALRLAQPCDCGRPHCTLRSHLWQSTLDAGPGIRATNYEPRGRTTPTNLSDALDGPDEPDPTSDLHERYKSLLDVYAAASRNLTAFIEAHRPDRWVPLPPVPGDDTLCRPHLDAGHLEDRHRGDLCRWCDDLRREFGAIPDEQLIRARERARGRRITQTDIGDWQARTRITRNITRRKKAS